MKAQGFKATGLPEMRGMSKQQHRAARQARKALLRMGAELRYESRGKYLNPRTTK